jgi:gliding motility-associated peptidyl-prolyl isomerase
MYKNIITYLTISLLVLNTFGCKNNNQSSARQPVSHINKIGDEKSVNLSKNLKQKEEAYIKNMITKDSLHKYVDSGHGFWYYYTQQNTQDTIYPKTGDKVTLNYEIRDLSDNIIYSSEEIGKKSYYVNHENKFRGFIEAVPLLKTNEEAWFLFPSNAAYGFHGDEKKIGQNIPLKIRIKIYQIEKQKK